MTSKPELRAAVPLHSEGMRIGLLGGSFNPPHQAHRDISLFAMKRLKLDRMWWLVTPGNPLKSDAPHSLEKRMEAARSLARHSRIDVSPLESAIGTRYTVDTIAFLKRRCAAVRFVWIMGADNLAQFHRWKGWRTIAGQVPIAVIDRPPESLGALCSPAAQALAQYRIAERDAAHLPALTPPVWVFLTGMKSPLSSTARRNPDGSWKA